MYVCMYVCTYLCTYLCMYLCMYVCTYVRMYVCMYVWYELIIRIIGIISNTIMTHYVHTNIYIYIHTHSRCAYCDNSWYLYHIYMISWKISYQHTNPSCIFPNPRHMQPPLPSTARPRGHRSRLWPPPSGASRSPGSHRRRSRSPHGTRSRPLLAIGKIRGQGMGKWRFDGI